MDILSIVRKAKETSKEWVKEELILSSFNTYFEQSFVSGYQQRSLESVLDQYKDETIPCKSYVLYVCQLGWQAGKEFRDNAQSLNEIVNSDIHKGDRA